MLAIYFPCIFVNSFNMAQFKFQSDGESRKERNSYGMEYLCLPTFINLLVHFFLCKFYFNFAFPGCSLFLSRCVEHIELLATFNFFWLEAPVMKLVSFSCRSNC
ncbi:unnamed protein product [Coffea canephora]|uniref:Uncharacterized protein n=1 Tax=Coffea canephora TaxID=49390 RepID=A0A068UVE5_COFCA|nr:unnamed protein product [Coffea canephora]